MKTIMYYFALILGAPFALLFFKFKITYEDKKIKPPKGAIIICPHKTWLDAIAVAYLFFFRRLYFLAADWYKGIQIIFKPFMLLLGCVLVDLSGKKYDFLSKSRSLLLKGRSILVFPEGDYLENKKLFEFGGFKTGYLLMAIESTAPIIPIVCDFSYGIFKRTHFKIGKPIYITLDVDKKEELRDKIVELNKVIRDKCLELFYLLKREKATKIKMCYNFLEPKKGDVIRVNMKLYYHYGVYLDDQNVIEFGKAINKQGEKIDIHLTTLKKFSQGQIPEVRVISKHIKKRTIDEIESYLKQVLGQENYSIEKNNCLDLANRLTLKI